ncbi:coiled-coil domain-containing protein 9 isoform X3 [Alligator mississippiensis]|uniref:coiled-coil domain-containing protein 9 isoform X3 n=1 Tax=Alligator mississippiensis TaxID=8496 RepID=UPI0028774A42|nr:coiled-coil domain-containing protein 9 isoform X3 [Alligator mississippiensis]
MHGQRLGAGLRVRAGGPTCRGRFTSPPPVGSGNVCHVGGAEWRPGSVPAAGKGGLSGAEPRGAVPAGMSAALDLKSKEEKDAELDRRIAALHKKNEAFLRRYQEIEEDRKRAEQEGIAVTAARRPRTSESDAERPRGDKNLSLVVQVALSPGEKRVVSDRRSPTAPKPGRSAPRGAGRAGPYPSSRSPRGEPPSQPPWEGAGGAGGDAALPGERGGGGRGRRFRGRGGAGAVLAAGDAGPDRKSKEWEERRRQNIEKMNEEMEKIAEYERNQRDGLRERNPVRNFLDDPRRSGPFQEVDRKEGSRRHGRNWGGSDFDKVKTGMEREKEWRTPGQRPGPRGRGALDMTLSMTGRERAEYMRWKQEREQIDQERLARHRKPTGQWRREWDAEKTDTMFKEGSAPAPGPDGGSRQDESRRPPKPPTFGEFLSEHRSERRRKGRGRGGGTSTKPYSMHDNRWEEKETLPPAEESDCSPGPRGEAVSPAAQTPPEPPAPPVPEEDEDQWEDVSGEEEEEDEGDEEEDEDGSGSSDEDKAPPPGSPKAQRAPKAGRGAAPKLAMPPAGVPAGEGKPLSPFSPVEGYRPVSDWGEEMELNSPRGNLGHSPLQGLGAGPQAQGVSVAGAATGVAVTPPAAEPAPGTVEITDFARGSGGP